MKVSELIAHLEEFQKEHGDLVVQMFDYAEQDFFPIREVSFRDMRYPPSRWVRTESSESSVPFGEIV